MATFTTIASRTSAAGDSFGSVIKASNSLNKLLITAPESTNKGKVYLYSYAAGNFTQTTILTSAPAASRAAGDQFGASLAMGRNPAMSDNPQYFVGVPGDRMVCVYENVAGPLNNQTYSITASDFATNANARGFGSALALSGRNLIVGCANDSTTLANAGACYSYFLTGGIEKYRDIQGKITSSDLAAGDQFGLRAAIFEDKMVISAPMKTYTSGGNLSAGAVYYFTYNPSLSTWSEQQKIISPVPETQGYFGASIDLKYNSLVIGAPTATVNNVATVGAAYYYTLAGSTFTLSKILTGYDVVFNAAAGLLQKYYGTSVALSGTTAGSIGVVVGAPNLYNLTDTDGSVGTTAGGVYSNLPSNGSELTFFNKLSTYSQGMGTAVSTDFPDIILVGAPANVLADVPGAVYSLAGIYIGDPLAKPVPVGPVPSRTEMNNTAIQTIELSDYITNSIPPTAYSATGLPTGVSIDTSTGTIAGTVVSTPGVYAVTPRASNRGGTTTGTAFNITVTNNAGNDSIPATGTVGVGSTAGAGRSINLLLTLAAGTPNSSLDAREKNAMDDLLTYGVCMPGQIQKDATWGPTGPGGTYRYTAISEWRGSYRWAAISAGVPLVASVNTNKSAGTGNALMTVTGNNSPAYTSASTPYSFYITGPSGRKPSSGWQVATLNSGQSYTFSPLAVGTYTCFVKDYQGCGSAEDLNIAVVVTYP
jgi:hypothetical protein